MWSWSTVCRVQQLPVICERDSQTKFSDLGLSPVAEAAGQTQISGLQFSTAESLL